MESFVFLFTVDKSIFFLQVRNVLSPSGRIRTAMFFYSSNSSLLRGFIFTFHTQKSLTAKKFGPVPHTYLNVHNRGYDLTAAKQSLHTVRKYLSKYFCSIQSIENRFIWKFQIHISSYTKYFVNSTSIPSWPNFFLNYLLITKMLWIYSHIL